MITVTNKRIISVTGILQEPKEGQHLPLVNLTLSEEQAKKLRDALTDALHDDEDYSPENPDPYYWCRWKWNGKAWNPDPECLGLLYKERPAHCPHCEKPTSATMPHEKES